MSILGYCMFIHHTPGSKVEWQSCAGACIAKKFIFNIRVSKASSISIAVNQSRFPWYIYVVLHGCHMSGSKIILQCCACTCPARNPFLYLGLARNSATLECHVILQLHAHTYVTYIRGPKWACTLIIVHMNLFTSKFLGQFFLYFI